MTNDQDKMSNELIAKDITYILRDMGEIKSSIKELAAAFITKIQFDETVKNLESSIKAVETELAERNKRDGSLWRFLVPTVMTIIGSVITFLLISYFQNAR